MTLTADTPAAIGSALIEAASLGKLTVTTSSDCGDVFVWIDDDTDMHRGQAPGIVAALDAAIASVRAKRGEGAIP